MIVTFHVEKIQINANFQVDIITLGILLKLLLKPCFKVAKLKKKRKENSEWEISSDFLLAVDKVHGTGPVLSFVRKRKKKKE